MLPDVPPLIDALLEPSLYPHPVDRVELMQTHGAWVLLAGDHAYKIKKPVALPFMDFSTLDKRRTACQAELRVNRRFSPADPALQIYLSALPITGTPRAPVIGGAPSQAIEWAVQMRRFPEADRLDHVADRGELTPGMMQSLARHLAAFQAGAAVAGPGSPWGTPDDVAGFARDNFASLHLSLTDDTDLSLVHSLSEWTERHLGQLTPLLRQRRVEGRVREGHGDLTWPTWCVWATRSSRSTPSSSTMRCAGLMWPATSPSPGWTCGASARRAWLRCC
ncbi:MAG: hypothetical protein ACLGG8_06120 [Gammaproteobacteria bacterium]